MHFVEVRKGVWQLSENDFCATAVHQVDVGPFKSVYEAFGDAIRLRTAHWCVDRLDAQLSRQRVRFMSAVRPAVVAQEFQLRRSDSGLAKSDFNSLCKHVSDRFAR